jgi:NTE family protein
MAPVPNLRTVRVVKYAAASAKLLSRYGSLGALAREGLIRIEDLEPLLRRHLDLKQVIGRPVSLFTTVTEITGLGNDRLGPRWFRLQDLDEESALKILAASLSLPFVSERIVVNGRSYVDGGIAQWAPMMPLYKGGSRKIVVVSTKAGLSCNPQDYPAATLHVIKPERPLGRFPLATFRFTRHAIIRWMSQGYQDASIFLDANPLR